MGLTCEEVEASVQDRQT